MTILSYPDKFFPVNSSFCDFVITFRHTFSNTTHDGRLLKENIDTSGIPPQTYFQLLCKMLPTLYIANIHFHF